MKIKLRYTMIFEIETDSENYPDGCDIAEKAMEYLNDGNIGLDDIMDTENIVWITEKVEQV